MRSKSKIDQLETKVKSKKPLVEKIEIVFINTDGTTEKFTPKKQNDKGIWSLL